MMGVYECREPFSAQIFRTSTKKYWLMNYEPFGEFDTKEESIQHMKWYPSYKDGELIWKISDQL